MRRPLTLWRLRSRPNLCADTAAKRAAGRHGLRTRLHARPRVAQAEALAAAAPASSRPRWGPSRCLPFWGCSSRMYIVKFHCVHCVLFGMQLGSFEEDSTRCATWRRAELRCGPNRGVAVWRCAVRTAFSARLPITTTLIMLESLYRGLSALGGAASTARSTKASLAARRDHLIRCLGVLLWRWPGLQAPSARRRRCAAAAASRRCARWSSTPPPPAGRRKFALPVSQREVERDWAAQGFHCGCMIDPPGARAGRQAPLY